MAKLKFKQWLAGLDDPKEMREHLAEICRCSKSSIDNYVAGRKVPPLVQEKINLVAGEELEYPVKTVKTQTND